MTIVELNNQSFIEQLASDWKREAAKLSEQEAIVKEAKEALIMACGGDFEGYGVKVEQIERKGSIDYARMPELANVAVEQYRKPSTVYWTVKASVKQ